MLIFGCESFLRRLTLANVNCLCQKEQHDAPEEELGEEDDYYVDEEANELESVCPKNIIADVSDPA